MRIREGVSTSVNEKMEAVNANVLREDGLLLRTCDHGIRHPVGDIHTGRVSSEAERLHSIACCAESCCRQWLDDAEVKATA